MAKKPPKQPTQPSAHFNSSSWFLTLAKQRNVKTFQPERNDGRSMGIIYAFPNCKLWHHIITIMKHLYIERNFFNVSIGFKNDTTVRVRISMSTNISLVLQACSPFSYSSPTDSFNPRHYWLSAVGCARYFSLASPQHMIWSGRN